MNAHDIREVGPVEMFLWSAIEWLNPIVYIVGLAVAVWAFRCCRRWGYLLVGFYFLLVLFTLFAMPSINRAIQVRIVPELSERPEQNVSAAGQQAIDRVPQEKAQAHAQAPPQQRTVRFPFGPLVLVLGLWLIARPDIDHRRANSKGCIAAQPATTPLVEQARMRGRV